MTTATQPNATPQGGISKRKQGKRPLYLPHERCKHKTPCGLNCVLSAAYRHVWHSCNREACDYCHGTERFGRAAK